MNSPLFPDVNVWLALHHQIHEHHEKALAWFEGLEVERRLVFCRQTHMGFFRLLTTGAVMGDEVLTKRQCWTLYKRWISGGKATLENEPAKMSLAFEQRTMTDGASPKEWTDAYLAAFAETAGIQLVTFDRALAGKAKGAVLLG